MISLLGVGSALLDQLCPVSDVHLASVPGGKGGMELVDAYGMSCLIERLPGPARRSPGGSTANTVMGLARLGLPVGLVAKLGEDPAGDQYREQMVAAGVDVRGLKVSPDLPTGCCLSLVTPDSERTMRTCLGAGGAMVPGDIVAQDFVGYDFVQTEGYLLFNRDLMLRVLETAVGSGRQVGLDLSSPEVVAASRDVLPELLARYVDVVFANETEATAFAGVGDEEEALAVLAGLCRVAVVKLGSRGALVQVEGERFVIPALRVQAVDTTGAGDLWASGFLYGLLRGWPIPEAGALAARVAAEVVQVLGAVVPESAWTTIRHDFPRLAG